MYANQTGTRSLGPLARLVPRIGKLPRRLPVRVPLRANTSKKEGDSRRYEWEDPVLKDIHDYRVRLVVTKETLSTPDGDLLRYVANEVYHQLLRSKAGRPKRPSEIWFRYIMEVMQKQNSWFNERGIGLPEMAMLAKVLDEQDTCSEAAHNAAPRPDPEVVDKLVHRLGEEWMRLWREVRPSD